MALTKSGAEVDAWAAIAQNTVREGATVDVSDAYAATLHIDCALGNTTAHTGTEIIVQLSSATSGDSFWSNYMRFIGPTGTAVDADFAGTEAAAQTVLSVTDPVTQNVDNNNKFKFVEHDTDANSEVVYQTAQGADAGDTVTVLDGITNEQTSSSNLLDVDSATVEAVSMQTIDLPTAALRVRVIYNNGYDPDGAIIYTRCRITKVTAL